MIVTVIAKQSKMGVADCVVKVPALPSSSSSRSRDCSASRNLEGGAVYDCLPPATDSSDDFTGEPSSTSSPSSPSTMSSILHRHQHYHHDSDADYPLRVDQTSHQCRCPTTPHSLSGAHHRDHDYDHQSRRRPPPTVKNASTNSGSESLPDSPETTVMTTSASSSSSSSAVSRRCGRNSGGWGTSSGGGGRKVSPSSPFVWPCVARAVFLFAVLMSCLGVNLARPSSSSSGLSEHEKHYRALQSRAVVSTTILINLYRFRAMT